MIVVTLGGVTVGLAILVRFVIVWWPGAKSLRGNPLPHLSGLLPFLAAWAYGAVTILGIGGLIGWAANTTLWISNWLGDAALVWGVGTAAGQAAARGTYLPLTQTGGALVLLMTVGVVTAVKFSRYGRDLKMGAWCGICLGTSAGIAGLAAVPLATAVNWAGQALYGALA
ncbi:hypothetical protein QMZ92_13230 [Streptomyces sp. HNM0645]|uniref:hypothetical protein n=1 Tax=Streptomyces sp. HNM0645 TaxID=2782343 RepID=UPI0024B757AF|nr:hypothetical protein [Streptomyces sp. HNM0645]MDI9885330.1 hypothetical protein [Streptomyces sp. HNM0645]